jgi:hypothetical protein
MTSGRAQAYGRVVKRLGDLGASKLHADEQQVVRDAADALFFCEDGVAAREAMAELDALMARLVLTERLLPETAAALVRDVESCGPVAAV